MASIMPSKLKCPKCGAMVLKVFKAGEGTCNSCGYAIADSMIGFVTRNVGAISSSS